MINKITEEDLAYFDRIDSMDSYQHIATKSAIYPGRGTSNGLLYCALKVASEAGELAGHVGKALRDDDFGPTTPLSVSRKALIIKEIGDELWYLSAVCNELGITLSQAALTNLEKLKSRTERNMLQGSGDER